MPALENPKHERFAQELAKGKTADEAYVIAGYKRNRGNASTLKQDQSILARVTDLLSEREVIHAQATADAIKSTALTKEWVIETLKENVARAMQATPVRTNDEGEPSGEYQYQGSVANRALELLGKELGMFVDRKEVGKPGEFESMNADQLREYISREAAELGLSPTAASRVNGSGKPH
jgi:phage terminase small subunit